MISAVRSVADRAALKMAELDIAAEIAASTDDRQQRLRLWVEKTGKSEQTLYRRLAQLRNID